jgi:hypothetical protein
VNENTEQGQENSGELRCSALPECGNTRADIENEKQQTDANGSDPPHVMTRLLAFYSEKSKIQKAVQVFKPFNRKGIVIEKGVD